ncbi:MAG: RnfH family protein [Xanthomonadales bacterium]|nr:RnfH family protein [Xanthomonadales bacterium]
MSGRGSIRVEVAHARPDKQVIRALDVPEGCTVSEAIALSGIERDFPELEIDPERLGIFGERVSETRVLVAGDRVEIYRPLIADPKEARRKRARKQG